MREPSSAWSLNCGLWGGVRVQLHASLVVAGVLMVYLASKQESGESLYGLLAWGVLLASTLVHEVGHSLAAWRLGGSTDLIVLGPLGGLHSPHVPREPHREVAVALAGPAANLVVMLILVPPLLMASQGANFNLADILLEPLHPNNLVSKELEITACLRIAVWLNWLLVLANLLPAAPLDGGRALRSILWPVMGYRGALRTLSRSGMLVALVLCLVAILAAGRDSTVWLPLVLMAIYLYFCARREMLRGDDESGEDDVFGYDFSQGYTSLERPQIAPRSHRGFLRRWLEQRRQIRQRRMREMEAEEERRVDEILIRIKEFGKESLTPEEQSLLERVSARYRDRLQS